MWFFSLLFNLFLALFGVLILPYKGCVYLFVSTCVYLCIFTLFFTFNFFVKMKFNKKTGALVDRVTDLSFCLLLILLTINPISKMNSEERNNLPCLGNVDPELKNLVQGFPEWDYTCKSVIHVGHGYYDQKSQDTKFISATGEIGVKQVTKIYEEKKQYILSCRGDLYQSPIKTLLTFSLSFGFQQKERETVNGKEVYYFAKKGNILIVNIGVYSNWFLFD